MINKSTPESWKDGWRRVSLRVLTPLFVALLLVAQIAAVPCQRAPSTQAALGHVAFQICHSASADLIDEGGDGERHKPQQQANCPFCSLHCALQALYVPPAASFEPTWIASDPAQLPLGTIYASVRYPAGASPRGPPRVV